MITTKWDDCDRMPDGTLQELFERDPEAAVAWDRDIPSDYPWSCSSPGLRAYWLLRDWMDVLGIVYFVTDGCGRAVRYSDRWKEWSYYGDYATAESSKQQRKER